MKTGASLLRLAMASALALVSASAAAWSIGPGGPTGATAAGLAPPCDRPGRPAVPGGDDGWERTEDGTAALQRLDLQYRDWRLDEARVLEVCG